jgi:ribose/xylose/arabinose/galactoside ABC-type transport system permease subunit
MLVTGAMIGMMNGFAIARYRMPPFMVTLVSMMFFSAFAIYLTKSENIAIYYDGFIALGRGGFSFLTWPLGIAVLLGVVAHIWLTRTVPGKWLYAVGRNPRAAVVSGIPTNRVIVGAYMFSGFCAALGSVLYSARLEAGRPTLGDNLLLDIIGATVIGGTSLFGGKGKIKWTVYGVLFFVLLSNTLNLLNLSYFTIDIVKGGIILLAALLDVTRSRLVAGS